VSVAEWPAEVWNRRKTETKPVLLEAKLRRYGSGEVERPVSVALLYIQRIPLRTPQARIVTAEVRVPPGVGSWQLTRGPWGRRRGYDDITRIAVSY